MSKLLFNWPIIAYGIDVLFTVLDNRMGLLEFNLDYIMLQI